MRRNTKTMYEWRKAYRDKEELMLERGFPEVSPHALFFLLAIHPYLNLIYYRSFCMQHMQEADFYLLCETPA